MITNPVTPLAIPTPTESRPPPIVDTLFRSQFPD